ncbi:hypothetical protein [Rhodosalinus sp.]|uniref:hypothetical protein n=1 Tax=Rhodosalinus sp. TaxID=2047741 RepID=UPI00397C8640
MLDWIAGNAKVLELGVALVTLFVWVGYLHIFLMSFLRQRTPVVLITTGASHDEQARCLITNMSSEPIYLLDVIADVRAGDERYSALVTERDELSFGDVTRPVERTNLGPLQGGAFLDIGSIAEVLHRVERRSGLKDALARAEELTLTAAFASGRASRIVAACRAYRVNRTADGSLSFVADRLMARQLRHGLGRWRVMQRLKAQLSEDLGRGVRPARLDIS